MKNSFKVISLIFSAGFPATLVAEFLGMHLPSPIDSINAFNAFVIALTLLIFITDYSHPAKSLALEKSACLPAARTDRFSSDGDNLRLAA